MKAWLFTLASLIAVVPSAYAASINSGYLATTVNRDYVAFYEMVGSDFSLTCTNPTRCGTVFTPWSFQATTVGQSIDLSSTVSRSAPGVETLILDGTMYSASSNLRFTTPSIVRTSNVTTVPFTFTGEVIALDGFGRTVRRLDLTGQGTTRAVFQEFGHLGLLRYEFAPSPAASQPPSPPVASTPPASPPVGPPLSLTEVAALPPSLLNLLRDCGMCIEVRDLGTMGSGRRGVQLTPVNGGFLSGRMVAELDPDPAGGPARSINPEPTTLLLLLPGTLWLIGRRFHELRNTRRATISFARREQQFEHDSTSEGSAMTAIQ